MNDPRITQIETKIVETKSLLTHWTQKLNDYQTTLTHLTNQLTEIKKQIKCQ